ncbi:MAG: MCE family protein [Planctomycetes bacterium]|nr:MCE family protein [Planctomycetota bacterium]
MAQSNTKRDFLLGSVFFGALALLLYYTIVLTGFSLEERHYMEAWFSNASGLKEGDAILVAGRQTGTVRTVSYHDQRPEDRRIAVGMEFDEVITLHRGYAIRISEFTVLGGRVIEIEPGPNSAPVLRADAELVGSVGTSAIAALGELVANNREAVTEIIENLRISSRALSQGEGPLGALLMDQDLKKKVEDFINAAGNLAKDVEAGQGIVGLLTTDQKARDHLAKLLADGTEVFALMSEISKQISQGGGLAGALVYDQQMRANAAQILTDLRQSTSTLRTTIEEANSGRGLLGAILTDPDLARDATQLLADLSQVSNRLIEGEGTVGKLLSEEIAYDEMMKALQLLTGALEDVREGQPVSSFAGMLFGSSF